MWSTTEPTSSSRTPTTRGRRTTSPADSVSEPLPDPSQPLRTSFAFELEQLKLQVEVMTLKVDEALQRSTDVLVTGDTGLAERVIAADDDIDDMHVSLTERCYELLCRQSPVASDLRLVVSVLRILGDLERVGDLCLRVVKVAPEQPVIAAESSTFDILLAMAREATDLFRLTSRAWSTQDLTLAKSLEARDDAMDAQNARLMEALLQLDGPRAVPIAIQSLLVGRALERISDHSVMIGERLRYMLTGSAESLSREVGP